MQSGTEATDEAALCEALGIREVLSPRYASLLSAWGIGQARVTALRLAGLEAPLGAEGLAADVALVVSGEVIAAMRRQAAPIALAADDLLFLMQLSIEPMATVLSTLRLTRLRPAGVRMHAVDGEGGGNDRYREDEIGNRACRRNQSALTTRTSRPRRPCW